MEPKYYNRKEFIKNTGLSLISIPALLSAFAYKSAGVDEATKADCILTPQTIEGPYYIQNSLLRKDVTENKPGLALQLKLKVINVNTCMPVPNAMVDIWHCDATGFYSGYPDVNPDGGGMFGGNPPPGGFPPPPGFSGADSLSHKSFPGNDSSMHRPFPPGDRDGMKRGFPPPPSGNDSSMHKPFPPGDRDRMKGGFPPPPGGDGEGGMHAAPTAPKETFLRGVQVTDANGEVNFLTIYPGWYAGRAVHIHCKVFLNKKSMVTTQFLFPQELSNELHAAHEPYKKRVPIPFTNENDMIAEMAGGEVKVLLKMEKTNNQVIGRLTLGIKA